MTVCQGGVLPVTMVSNSTDLQISPTAGILGIQGLMAITVKQTIQQDTINSAGTNSTVIVNSTGVSSRHAGSVANIDIANSSDTTGPGGDNFHTGKHFVASTPIETAGLMMTSVAT